MNNYKNYIHIWINDSAKKGIIGDKEMLNIITKYYGFGEVKLSHYKTGKPYFRGFDTKISISRSGGLTVYALSYKDEVGMDIEKIHALADIANFSKYIFTDKHANDIASHTSNVQLQTFYKYWTLYEAYAKLAGEGLANVLQDKKKLELNIDNNLSYTFMIKRNCVGAVISNREKRLKFFRI